MAEREGGGRRRRLSTEFVSVLARGGWDCVSISDAVFLRPNARRSLDEGGETEERVESG